MSARCSKRFTVFLCTLAISIACMLGFSTQAYAAEAIELNDNVTQAQVDQVFGTGNAVLSQEGDTHVIALTRGDVSLANDVHFTAGNWKIDTQNYKLTIQVDVVCTNDAAIELLGTLDVQGTFKNNVGFENSGLLNVDGAFDNTGMFLDKGVLGGTKGLSGAGTYGVENGFFVSGPTSDYTYINGILTVLNTGDDTIHISNVSDDPAVPTKHRIVVTSQLGANISLEGVNIDVSADPNEAAFNMQGSKVNLNLQASFTGMENTLKSSTSQPAIEANNTASLTIAGKGILNLEGSAGIGGSTYANDVNIIDGEISVLGDIGGIEAGTLNVDGGTLEVDVQHDYAYAIEAGTFDVSDGMVTIFASGKEVQAVNTFTTLIDGGEVTVTATGENAWAVCTDAATIHGGTVVLNGIGGGLYVAQGQEFFTTGGITGHAFLDATSLMTQLDGDLVPLAPVTTNAQDSYTWGGVIFTANTIGTVYGEPTLTERARIAPGKTLFIEEGQTLSLADGITLTNDGAIINRGVLNGAVSGTPVFVPVNSITGVPTAATAGVDLVLTGTVNPANASVQTIVWSVKDAGTTGAVVNGNKLSTKAAGTVVLTATLPNGAAQGANIGDYVQDVTITVAAGAADDGKGENPTDKPKPAPTDKKLVATGDAAGALPWVLVSAAVCAVALGAVALRKALRS